MKLSSAAITVATISLLSATHAAPLAFKDGEITGRLHHRRGSDLSEVSEVSSSSHADEALEELDIGFEPGSSLILPRILNFIKRQVSTGAASLTGAGTGSTTTGSTSTSSGSNRQEGTSDTDFHTVVMSPDYESYGFASESGPGSALVPVKEVKE